MISPLSVIIPSLNKGYDLRETVYNIIDTLEMDNYEIIVVNSASTEVSEIKDPNMIRIFNSETHLGASQLGIMGLLKHHNLLSILCKWNTLC